MAQDLSQSKLLDIQGRLEGVFAGENPTTQNKVKKIATLIALMGHHNAQLSEVFDAGGRCIGQNILWRNLEANTQNYSGDGTDTATFNAAYGCEITSDKGFTSYKKLYKDNWYVSHKGYIADEDCSNEFQMQELLTDLIERLSMRVFDDMNIDCINFLNSNRTNVNNDADLPSGITWDNVNFEYNAALAKFSDPDFLADLYTVIDNSLMFDAWILNGRNHFFNAVYNSQYRRNNDSERHLTAFDDWDMAWDIKHLNAELTGANSFVVGEGSYAMSNRKLYGDTPEEVKDNFWQFSIDIGSLEFAQKTMTMRNGRPVMVNGMTPVALNVIVQDKCNGVDPTTKRKFDKHVEVGFVGLLEEAPAAANGHTGILKFKST